MVTIQIAAHHELACQHAWHDRLGPLSRLAAGMAIKDTEQRGIGTKRLAGALMQHDILGGLASAQVIDAESLMDSEAQAQRRELLDGQQRGQLGGRIRLQPVALSALAPRAPRGCMEEAGEVSKAGEDLETAA